DLVVGYTVSNRDAAETKHLVGPVWSALSIRSELSSNTTISKFLSELHSNVLEAQTNFVPFEKLLEQLELEPSLSHAPVFQVSFSFQTPDAKLEEFRFDDGVAGLDLSLDVFERLDRLECHFRYSTDLFDLATIDRLADHFDTVLQGIVHNPNERVCALPLLTQAE